MPHPSAGDTVTVTPAYLRSWPLPEAKGGKEGRGRTLIVGGSAETPGAVLLAAEAALRSGAGKLQVATAESVAAAVAVALPEALVRGLPETSSGAILGSAADRVRELAAAADCLLLGPGLADPGESAELVRELLVDCRTPLILDALALAAVTDDVGCLRHLAGRCVLTPNPDELAHTLHLESREVAEQPAEATARLAEQSGAVVSLGGEVSWVAAPDGDLWSDPSGAAGLGVSGSGDVRAGIVAGLVARGATPPQAAVWAAHLHGRAGERLASTVGRLGFLARELPGQIPPVLAEIEQ
jgi:hydroxyethylthiazole kinase-like uncharacterized protein yjeF